MCDGSLEEWQSAVAGCWWRVAEVEDVMKAVEGVLLQVHGDVGPDEGEVLMIGVGREGKPVEEQRSGISGGGAEGRIEGPVCIVLGGHVREAVKQVG